MHTRILWAAASPDGDGVPTVPKVEYVHVAFSLHEVRYIPGGLYCCRTAVPRWFVTPHLPACDLGKLPHPTVTSDDKWQCFRRHRHEDKAPTTTTQHSQQPFVCFHPYAGGSFPEPSGGGSHDLCPNIAMDSPMDYKSTDSCVAGRLAVNIPRDVLPLVWTTLEKAWAGAPRAITDNLYFKLLCPQSHAPLAGLVASLPTCHRFEYRLTGSRNPAWRHLLVCSFLVFGCGIISFSPFVIMSYIKQVTGCHQIN